MNDGIVRFMCQGTINAPAVNIIHLMDRLSACCIAQIIAISVCNRVADGGLTPRFKRRGKLADANLVFAAGNNNCIS